MNTFDFDPFDLLSVTRDASDVQIKKAYRKASKTCHPDIAGDNEESVKKFRELTTAKDTLLDPESKRAYMRGGWELVERLHTMKQMHEQRVEKVAPIEMVKHVTLSELYHHATIPVDVDVPIHGEDGTITTEKFHVDMKLENGECSMVIEGKGARAPDHIPGDIVVKVLLKDKSFSLRQNDIIYTAKLDLIDLITGYQIVIDHPKTGKMAVSGSYNFDDGENDNILIFEGKGMPASRRNQMNQGSHGALIVRVVADLTMLQTLNSTVKSTIVSALGKQFGDKLKDPNVKDITSLGLTPRDLKQKQRGHIPPELAAMLMGGDMGGVQMQMGGQDGPGGCPVS